MGSRRIAVLAVVGQLTICGSAALGQGGQDVRVNRDAPGRVQNETSLTLNPAVPGNVVMAFNDDPYPGTAGLGVAYSTDYGGGWTHQRLPVPTGLTDAFDPVTAADNRGYVYAGYIATDGNAGGRSGLYLHASSDGGVTWPWSGLVAGSPTNLIDKPHIATDTRAGSPYLNSLYAVWIRDFAVTGPYSDIYFSHAIMLPPVGLTFFPAMMISDRASGVGMGCGPNIAVASDGTIYVVWLDADVTGTGLQQGTIFLDKSTDGGFNFGVDIPVRQILTVSDPLFPHGPVARSFPCVETSPTNPAELYIVYAENPAGAPYIEEIFFLKSTNGGNTWSRRQISAVQPGNDHEFEPWIAVKPDGTIDVAWYESWQSAPTIDWWDVMITRSVDGGTTWAYPAPINDTSFRTPTHASGLPWMGEYLGIVVDNTHAYVGFTSSVRDPLGDVYFDRVENRSILVPCPPDINGDRIVDVLDLLSLLATWGPYAPCPPYVAQDINQDCAVDVLDLLALLAAWGPCP